MNKIDVLLQFMPAGQRAVVHAGLRGEERQFFADKLSELTDRINAMPKTYEQDGLGNQAVAHLHYFKGSGDWYITERDIETPDEPGQHQAFGLADLGHGAELGYISIVELVRNGVELDFHFTPCTIGELKQTRQAA